MQVGKHAVNILVHKEVFSKVPPPPPSLPLQIHMRELIIIQLMLPSMIVNLQS